MFIFVFHLAVSSGISLLVMGYGNSDFKSSPYFLFDAITTLRRQIEGDRDALSKISDPVAIDYWLAKQSRIFAIDTVEVVALSLSSQTAIGVGGGVIGSPFEGLLPAQSKLEFITKDICIVAFPEGPGVALIGVSQEQVENFMAKLNRLDIKKRNIAKILDLAAETTAKAAIVVLDGCGLPETGGGFYIKEPHIRKEYGLPERSFSGNCCLELYMCDSKWIDFAD